MPLKTIKSLVLERKKIVGMRGHDFPSSAFWVTNKLPVLLVCHPFNTDLREAETFLSVLCRPITRIFCQFIITTCIKCMDMDVASLSLVSIYVRANTGYECMVRKEMETALHVPQLIQSIWFSIKSAVRKKHSVQNMLEGLCKNPSNLPPGYEAANVAKVVF